MRFSFLLAPTFNNKAISADKALEKIFLIIVWIISAAANAGPGSIHRSGSFAAGAPIDCDRRTSTSTVHGEMGERLWPWLNFRLFKSLPHDPIIASEKSKIDCRPAMTEIISKAPRWLCRFQIRLTFTFSPKFPRAREKEEIESQCPAENWRRGNKRRSHRHT